MQMISLVSAAASVLLGAAISAPAAARPLLKVTADPRQPSRQPSRHVPSSFIGFSQEYNIVASQVGNHKTGVNPVAVGLFQNFSRVGAGTPVLRIGGGSTDGTTWNPTGKPKPRGIDFGIDYPLTIGLANFTKATGARLILGLNMGLNDPSVAVEEASNLTAALPPGSIRAFEVGNEPDYFDRRPYGFADDGRQLYARGKSYSVGRYLPEIRRFTTALRRLRPRPPLAGPGLCCDVDWLRGLPRILAQEHRRLKLVTIHRYPLFSCGHKFGQRGYPTAAMLLRRETIGAPFRSFLEPVRIARAAGLPFRVTETNSVACGGARGASDVFASALWAADWAFALAAIGVSGADFHGSSPLYQAFRTRWQEGRFVGEARPLYYGLLLFASATAHNARILPSSYYPVVRSGANVRTWGTYDRHDRVVRVVVLNKDFRAHGPAHVRVPGAKAAGTLVRLLAPSLRSRTGVTLGGQSVASPSLDGLLTGSEVTRRVRRRNRSTFRFDVPAGSAAMLTVPLRRP